LKSKLSIVFALGFGFSIAPPLLFAHHGGAAYDTEKRVTLKGTVVSWFWANPHCVLQLDVTDESGQVVHWNIESENPSTLIKLGWSRQSMKAGDQITITAVPVRNGKPIGRMWEAVLADGEKLDAPHGFAGGVPGGTQKPEDSPK
jgi:hypothetical protein